MQYDEAFSMVVEACGGDTTNDQWRFSIERVTERSDCGLELWRYLNPTDLSRSKHFVLCSTPVVLEVDFLSRHEIAKPYSPENMPTGWRDWAIRRGNSLLVHNRGVFVSRLLTADLFLALPKHRFQSFADDVRDHGLPTGKALINTLKHDTLGYSFIVFAYHKKGHICPCLVHSILDGEKYEHTDMFRSASEQLELR